MHEIDKHITTNYYHGNLLFDFFDLDTIWTTYTT